MAFKVPKGDIRWWSILWLVAGLFLVIVCPGRGEITLAVMGGVLAISVALIWFDQKWIAPPLMILYGLNFLARIVGLFTKGITLSESLRVLVPLYFMYLVWDWYRSEELATPQNPNRIRTTSPFDTPRDDDRWSNPYQESPQDER